MHNARLSRFIPMAAAVLFLVAGRASAAETTYYLGTATKHTNITFVSEAEIENIYGRTHQMSGTFTVDWEKGTAKASFSVPVASMQTGIAKRDEHLRGEQWLNAKKYPNITLTSEKVTLTPIAGKKGRYDVTIDGVLTIKGVPHHATYKAKLMKVPVRLHKKLGGGEWIKLTSRFQVNFDDHNITIPHVEMVGPKVSKTWDIEFNAFATTKKPAR